MHTSYMMCNCCLKEKQYDLRFLRFCKRHSSKSTGAVFFSFFITVGQVFWTLVRATLQFCFLKPPMAVITIILASKDKYSEGNWDPTEGRHFLGSKAQPIFRLPVYLYHLQHFCLAGPLRSSCLLCRHGRHFTPLWSDFEVYVCKGTFLQNVRVII